MAESRTVLLASGGSITVSLDRNTLKLARDERALVCSLLDRIDEYEFSQTQVGKLIAIVTPPAAATITFEPTFVEQPTCVVEPISNIDTKANIDRDLKPENVIRCVRCKATDHDSKDCPIYSGGLDLLNHRPAEDVILETALALPEAPVQSWPTVTVKRESIADKALKLSGAVVDSAKSLDAFRAAAKDRRDKLAKETARAKERLAAARARTEELEAQRKARQGRCSVAPPERDPVLARANREKLPERSELPAPSSTWVL